MTTVVGWMAQRPSLGQGRGDRQDREGTLTSWHSWQGVGWIYWLDVARGISFWCAFIESCSPVWKITHALTHSCTHASTHPRIHASTHPRIHRAIDLNNHWLSDLSIALLTYLPIRLLALLLLFWLGSATGHRPHTRLLPLFTTHAAGVTATSVLLPCTGVFTKLLVYLVNIRSKKVFGTRITLFGEAIFTRLTHLKMSNQLSPWLEFSLRYELDVVGRPRNSRREPFAFEIAWSQRQSRCSFGNMGGNVVVGVYQGLGMEMLIERETVVILHAKINLELIYVADYHLQVCFQMELPGRWGVGKICIV